MLDDKDLTDPTGSFIEAVRKSTRIRGDRIAKEHFEGDMAVAMGEVFGDWLAGAVICGIGSSLYDVPMSPMLR